MKLDPRIKSLSDILTIFDIERAKQFIGQKGYFADSLYYFDDLGSCYHDTLTDACDGQGGPFHRRGDVSYQEFFIPESSLNPAEKKYRPFASTEEFFRKTNFTECDLIYIRSKASNLEYHLVLIGWSDKELMLGCLHSLSFDELFQRFELWDGEDKFIPFGVEE